VLGHIALQHVQGFAHGFELSSKKFQGYFHEDKDNMGLGVFVFIRKEIPA
jgi:hypothetical protein